MSASAPNSQMQEMPTPPWRAAGLAVAVALAVMLGAYWDTLASMVLIWSGSETFTHGFLIVPIVGFLIWQQRAQLRLFTPQSAPVALLFLAGMVLLWCVGRLLVVNVVQHFAVVMMIPALLWWLLGHTIMKHLAFPMAYLLFAVPFGEFLVPTLQDITATISVRALQLTGIPVLWEGLYFYIPSGNFEVAEACSGVRYLIASLALGTLYAYLTYHSLWRRAAFIALAIIVPVIANGVRAYGIVMIAHLSDYQLAVGVDHFIYGWVFFGAVMLVLFWLGNYFRDAPVLPSAKDSVPVAAAVTVSSPRWGGWVIALAIVLSGPLLNFWWQRDSTAPAAFDLQLPAGVGRWSGPHPSTDTWLPKFHGATAQQRGEYRGDGASVQVYVAYYAQQRSGAELVHTENTLFDSLNERRLGENVDTLSGTDGSAWTVRALRIQSEHSERLIWSWYLVAGHPTAHPLVAKLYEARARIFGGRGGSALIALATSDAENVAAASARLQAFHNDMRQPLHASVGDD